MNSKRSIITFSLGLALVLILMWMTSSPFDPARAYTDTNVTPTPTIDGDGVPRIDQSILSKEQFSDGQSQTQLDITPLMSSSAEIGNGDFENGQDGTWEEYSTHGWDIITNASNLPVTPHSGSWAAWLGGEHEDVSFISQSVTVPNGVSTLSFWNWIASADACGYDFGWVKINDTNVQNIDLCEDNNTDSWVERSIDLSAYAGQTIILQIRVETDGLENSNYFVDDVTLGTVDTTAHIYLPVTLANFWAGYFDDFSDSNSGWVSRDNDYWTLGYLNGEYQTLLKNPQGSVVVTPDLILSADYSIEVDARQANSNISSYGLMFGIKWGADTYEGYQIIVYPTTQEYLLNKRSMDGSWTVLRGWTYSSAIHQGMGTNHFRVDRIGTRIDLYINNAHVTTFTDSSFTSSGRDAGVRAYGGDDVPVDVRFDNFSASLP